MKIVEILGGIRLPLNEEEHELLNKIQKQMIKEVTELNEREKVVALDAVVGIILVCVDMDKVVGGVGAW